MDFKDYITTEKELPGLNVNEIPAHIMDEVLNCIVTAIWVIYIDIDADYRTKRFKKFFKDFGSYDPKDKEMSANAKANWKALMIKHNFAFFSEDTDKLNDYLCKLRQLDIRTKNIEQGKFYSSIIKTVSDMQKNKKVLV